MCLTEKTHLTYSLKVEKGNFINSSQYIITTGGVSMKIILRAFVVSLALSFIGCSTLSVNTEYDKSATFSGLKTYGWLPAPQKLRDDPRIDWEILDSYVKNAVDELLATKGFSRLTSGEPDLLVAYNVILDKKVIPTTLDSTYAATRPPGWASFDYEEGILILNILEADTHKLMWQSRARDEVSFVANPEKKKERVSKAVRLMLENFPPA
jgi:hypothetical protein